MHFKHFINHLSLRANLSSEHILAVQSRVKQLHINKGSQLLYPGDVCKHTYFVVSGFFRIYQTDGFEEETVDFSGPNQFVTSLHNFLNQKADNKGIICEEDAIVFKISYYDCLALEDLSAEFLLLNKQIMLEYIREIYDEKDIYRLSNATQKYLYLSTKYQGISNIVSQKHIASYLGITPPSLSALLKELLRKPK